jgi:hypothetical protein
MHKFGLRAFFRAMSIVASSLILKLILDTLPKNEEVISQILHVGEGLVVVVLAFVLMNMIANLFKYEK